MKNASGRCISKVLVGMEHVVKLDSLVADMEERASPAELRRVAASLLRLADALDQEWSSESAKSRFSVLSEARRFERNALELAKVAVLESRRSQVKARHLGSDLVGDPVWNILTELFQQFAGGAKVSTKSAQLVAGCPETTALRIIDRLDKADLITRSVADNDRRLTLLCLTKNGVMRVGAALEELGY